MENIGNLNLILLQQEISLGKGAFFTAGEPLKGNFPFNFLVNRRKAPVGSSYFCCASYFYLLLTPGCNVRHVVRFLMNQQIFIQSSKTISCLILKGYKYKLKLLYL